MRQPEQKKERKRQTDRVVYIVKLSKGGEKHGGDKVE